MTQEQIDENFREVASKNVDLANLKIKHANDNLRETFNTNSEFSCTSLKDDAAEQMCFASELMLKGNLIYDDFRKHPRFRNDPYSPDNDKVLGKPDKILNEIIMFNDENDERLKTSLRRENGILIDANGNPLPLKSEHRNDDPLIALQLYKDNDNYLSGHNPFPYFQLQGSVPRSLIDIDFYCKASEKINWTILALLTDDLIKKSEDGKTIMPRNQMEKIAEIGNSSVKFRYSPLSNVHVPDDLLLFIKDFTDSLQNVSNFRFLSPHSYEQIDFDMYDYSDFDNGLSCLNFLDKTSRYRLKSLFSKNEINALIGFKKVSNLSSNDFIKLVYSSIYLKNYIKNTLDINLEFTEKQFVRIYDLCDALRAYQIFDPNNQRFRDTFESSEKEFYINRCEQMSNSNLKIEHKSFFEELSVKYSEDEICSLLNSEEYKKYPYLFIANNCFKHGIDELKKFVSSDIFLKHKDLISSNNLLVNNDLIYIYACLDDDFMNNYPGLICTEVLRKTTLNKIFKISSNPAFFDNYTFKDLVESNYDIHLLLNSYLYKSKITPTYNEFTSYVPYDSEDAFISNHFDDLITPDNVDIIDHSQNISKDFGLNKMFSFNGTYPCDYAYDEDNAAIFQKECDIHGYEDFDINESQKKK